MARWHHSRLLYSLLSRVPNPVLLPRNARNVAPPVRPRVRQNNSLETPNPVDWSTHAYLLITSSLFNLPVAVCVSRPWQQPRVQCSHCGEPQTEWFESLLFSPGRLSQVLCAGVALIWACQCVWDARFDCQ
jgi:hypothetical protein